MAIPKLLHQTVQSLPAHPDIMRNMDFLKRENPAWKYSVYDDKDCRIFVQQNYGVDILKIYDRFQPSYGAARADLFRYLLMYEKGGVYLDIKSSCEKPLDLIIREDDHYLLSHWKDPSRGLHMEHGVDRELQQWHIITAPRHPFLKAVIAQVCKNAENYNPSRDGVGKIGVLKLTGPIAYTRTIAPISAQYPHRMVNIEDEGFLYSVLMSDDKKSFHRKLVRRHYVKSTAPILKVGPLIGAKHRFDHLVVQKLRKLRKKLHRQRPEPAS